MPKTIEPPRRDLADHSKATPIPEAFPERELEEAGYTQVTKDDDGLKFGDYGGAVDDEDSTPPPPPGAKTGPRGRPEQTYASDADPTDEVESGEPSQSDYQDYGLTREQALKLDEEGRLVEVMNAADQHTIRLGQYPGVGPRQSGASNRGTAQQPAQTGQAVPGLIGDFKLELSPEEYDPKFVKQMEALNDFHNKRFQRLEMAVVGQYEREEFARQQQAINNFDQWVGNLPAEYHETFGSGPITQLRPDGMEVLKRQELFETFTALANGYAQQGRGVPPEQLVRERALRVVSGGDLRRKGRQEGADAVAKQRQRLSNRPTARESSPGSPEERAVRFAESWKRSRGD